jgi:hypothetical protein
MIVNTSLMPTHSGPDLKHHISRPDYVTLGNAESVSVAVIGTNRQIIAEQKGSSRAEISNIPSRGEVSIRWVVEGNGPYTIVVDSVKGGTVSASTK